MSTAIRWASTEDAPQLAELRWLSRPPHEQASEALPSFTARFGPWLIRAFADPSWLAVVAAIDQRLDGCMYLRVIETVPVPGIDFRAWGCVSHAFVRGAARNRGFGSAMLDQVIEQARRLGLEDLQVWPSQDAISLYTRAGFLSPAVQSGTPHIGEPSYLLPLRRA